MRNQIAKMWVQIGMMTGKRLDREIMEMMLEAVADLPEELVLNALKTWAMTETTFPMPANIRAKINPTMSEKDVAIDAVNTAIACVSRFGYTNPQLASERMGELAWATVQRFGGWGHLCETLTNENEGMIRAQLRELAQVVFKKSQRGELDARPKLPMEYKNLLSVFEK
jgi:hypothetical protein